MSKVTKKKKTNLSSKLAENFFKKNLVEITSTRDSREFFFSFKKFREKKVSQKTLFQNVNTLTNARKHIIHDKDIRSRNGTQSAVLLQSSSQTLLDMCITAVYISLSSLLCPGCIKWIKAPRAAKHLLISSTLRVRAADSIL